MHGKINHVTTVLVCTLMCACSVPAIGTSGNQTDSGGGDSSNSESGTSGGANFEPNGDFYRCSFGTGTICIPRDRRICGEFDMGQLYVAAQCAYEFGGNPTDYLDEISIVTVDDYPSPGEDTELCESEHDFSITNETPTVTNYNPFHDDSLPSECGWESYCALVDEVAEEFPGFETPAICNVAPDGDSDTLAPWRCVGSGSSTCGAATVNDNEDVAICPLPNFAEPLTEICVLASDSAEALEKCTEHCQLSQGQYEFKDFNSDDFTITTPLQCDAYDEGLLHWVSNVATQCYDESALPGLENFRPFTFTTSLVIDNGASAASGANPGLLSYTVGKCTQGKCPVTIDGILLPDQVYSGVFVDASGSPMEYSVSGLSIKLLSPATGVLDKKRKTVLFPESTIDVVINTDAVTLDGEVIPALEDVRLEFDQVVGKLQGKNRLTLNVVQNTPDSTMTISLQTRKKYPKK